MEKANAFILIFLTLTKKKNIGIWIDKQNKTKKQSTFPPPNLLKWQHRVQLCQRRQGKIPTESWGLENREDPSFRRARAKVGGSLGSRVFKFRALLSS